MKWLKRVFNKRIEMPVKRLVVGGVIGVSLGALGITLTTQQTDVLITALLTLWA